MNDVEERLRRTFRAAEGAVPQQIPPLKSANTQPRHRLRWFVPTAIGMAVAVAATIVVVNLGQPHSPGAPAAEQGETYRLPLFEWDRKSAEQALLSGRLNLDDGCLVVGGTFVMWPNGFTASTDGQGVVHVFGFDGSEVARTGAPIHAGGGMGHTVSDPFVGPGKVPQPLKCIIRYEHAFYIQDALGSG